MKNKEKIKNYVSLIVQIIIYAIAFHFTYDYFDIYLISSGILSTSFIVELSIYVFLLAFSFYIQIIIHELGHLVFGLLTGYHFLSFRIANLMLMKKDDKFVFKKYSLSGTAGQCLMSPPELDDNKCIPYFFYNLGGVLMNLISSLMFLGLFLFMDNLIIKTILFFIIVLGIASALVNGIPLETDGIPNDGYNILYLTKNKNSIYYYWLQLKINELLSFGKTISDIPKKWLKMPDIKELNTPFASFIGAVNCNVLLINKDYNKTGEFIEKLLKSNCKLDGINKRLLICDLIYCYLIANNFNKINELLDKEQVKFMKSMKDFISVVRTNYLLAKFYEKNLEKAEILKKKFEQVLLTHPYESDVINERNLVLDIEQKFDN